MLLLVEEVDVYLDFGVYIIHLSLGTPCEIKLDEMDEQISNLRGL